MGWRADLLRLGAQAALLGHLAGAARALPEAVAEALTLPEGAEILRDAASEPDTVALPVRTAGSEGGVSERISGMVSRRALRVPDGPATLTLVDEAEAALSALGFETRLRCATEACGGFAFRNAIDVLPQPEMALNLADFRQLTMRRAEAEGGETLVALLASRFGNATLAQITVVEDARPARTVSAGPGPVVAPAMSEGETDPAPPPIAARDAPSEDGAAALLAALRERGGATLEGVDFEPGSTTLDAASADAIADAAEALRRAPELRALVVGHTDASGSLAVNRQVSQARAEAVRDALVAAGVAGDRIAAEGAGYLAPRAPHRTETGRALNRRVELVALP